MAFHEDKVSEAKIAYTALFGSLGWSMWKKEVQELLHAEQGAIEQLTVDALPNTSLTDLNAAISRRNAILKLLYLEEAIKEEIQDNSPDVA